MTFTAKFLAFLKASSHIIPLVRELRIIKSAEGGGFEECDRDWVENDTEIPQLIRILVNLKIVYLDGMEWEDVTQEYESARNALLQRPSLAHVTLANIDLPYDVTDTCFVNLFGAPTLQSLHLHGVRIDSLSRSWSSQVQPIAVALPHGSLSLSLDDVRIDHFVTWFLFPDSNAIAIGKLSLFHLQFPSDEPDSDSDSDSEVNNDDKTPLNKLLEAALSLEEFEYSECL